MRLVAFPSGRAKGCFQNSTHENSHNANEIIIAGKKKKKGEKKNMSLNIHIAIFIYTCISHSFSAHVQAEKLKIKICQILIILTFPKKLFLKLQL